MITFKVSHRKFYIDQPKSFATWFISYLNSIQFVDCGESIVEIDSIKYIVRLDELELIGLLTQYSHNLKKDDMLV